MKMKKTEVNVKVGDIKELVKIFEKDPDPERRFWIDVNTGIVYEKLIVEY